MQTIRSTARKKKPATRLLRGFYRDLLRMVAQRADKWERGQRYCKQCFFCGKGCAPGLIVCRAPDAGAFPENYLATMEAGERGYCRWFTFDYARSEAERNALISAIRYLHDIERLAARGVGGYFFEPSPSETPAWLPKRERLNIETNFPYALAPTELINPIWKQEYS